MGLPGGGDHSEHSFTDKIAFHSLVHLENVNQRLIQQPEFEELEHCNQRKHHNRYHKARQCITKGLQIFQRAADDNIGEENIEK